MPPTLLTTAINALRYPSAANNGADFATGIEDLAADIDPRLPKLVTALPGSPVDKQEVYYQSAAMATDGVIWHLRYRSGASGSYKWEFVGGVPWLKEVAADENTASTSYANLSTVGPSVTAPLTGEWIVRIGANILASGTGGGNMSFACGATPASSNDSAAFTTAIGVGEQACASVARDVSKTLTAGDAIVAKYAALAGSPYFAARFLSIVPVRVG